MAVTLADGKSDGDGLRSFKIDGLAASTSSNGMKNEILLLAWLIVLLRTREDGDICYDWTYTAQGNALEHAATKFRLSTGEVMAGLHNTVGQVASSIFHHIAAYEPMREAPISHVASLLLSNSSSSKRSEATDDVSEKSEPIGVK
ncbi:non-ribosomal peptide synthetase [Aspergillus sclerotialis]|uniref:Non-ribosomal peptide synthetase n=1 Tax=Aspergillus sclerotialis TaxID=2070753 RepID=A0A3A2ZJA4_9EURO|nr:non-ribosomal peptide synthetase [Aspergillus sclerotialis]